MIEYVEAAWERGAPAFHITHVFYRAGSRRSQGIGFSAPTLMDASAASSDCSRSARIRRARNWSPMRSSHSSDENVLVSEVIIMSLSA